MTRWLLLVGLLTLTSPVAAGHSPTFCTGPCMIPPSRMFVHDELASTGTPTMTYFTEPSIPAGREPTEAEEQQLYRDMEAPCPPGFGRESETCSGTKYSLVMYLTGVAKRRAERDELHQRDARLLSQIRQILREEIQAWSGRR